MSFYDECVERDIDIPDEYDMKISEMLDVCENAPEPCAIAHFCFEYGFQQGRSGKEAELAATAPAKTLNMKAALDRCRLGSCSLFMYS